jgi:hypothetical protein
MHVGAEQQENNVRSCNTENEALTGGNGMTSAVEYRRGEIQSVNEMAQQIIDNMGSSYVPRASRNRQPYQPPSMRPSDNQAYQRRYSAPDTSQDTQIAPSARQPYSAPPSHPRRRWHSLLWFGTGMLAFLVLWVVALCVYSAWVLNVSDRWDTGPNHIRVVFGVFGHNNDSAESPTQLQAFVRNDGLVEVIELPGDASHSHIYTSPGRLVGDDLSHAVIDIGVEDVKGDGKPDVTVTVYGSSFGWNFQRQSLMSFTLVNTGDSFKPQPNGGG